MKDSPGWSLYSNFAREHPVSALPQPYQGLQHRSSLQAAAFPTGQEQGHKELSSSSRFSLLHLPTLGQPPSQSPTIQPTNQNHTFASTETFSVEALVQQHLQNGSFLPAGVLTSIEGRLHVAKGSLPVSVGAYLARTLPPTNHASVVPAFQMSSRRSVNALPATTGPHKGLQRNDALQALRIALMEGGIDLEASATAPFNLPRPLALLEDNEKLSLHQVFLRFHIEAFKASEEDISTHTRGRNRAISMSQVGIRCRHCAHLPLATRQKGSVYFPSSLLGIYQAAQNMSTQHLQCGLCSSMPVVFKQQFAMLLSSKASSSGAGRAYWAEAAKKICLVGRSVKKC